MSGTIVAIALMVLVLIGMLVVKKTMAASPMLQPVLFVCVALELGLVVFVFYKQLGKSSTGALERQFKIYHAKGFVAGEAIKAKASGKVLVVVNSGNYRGEKATVVAVLSKNDRVVLKLDKGDANLGKRTVKKSKANPNGGLVERAVSVHVSNVKKAAAEAKSE